MWKKKILNGFIGLIILSTVIFAGIQSIRVSNLSRSVEQYRSELATARDANRRYAETYRETVRTNTEIGECLSRHVSTISELREQFKTIKSGYEKMQGILEDLENSRHLSDRGDDTDDNRSDNL